MTTEAQVHFREDQQFRGPWMWLIVITACILSIASGTGLLIWQVLLGNAVGNNPMPDAAAAAIGLFQWIVGFGIAWMMWAAKLQVEVSTAGLFVRFYPFHRKVRKIDLTDLVEITPVRYSPIREYGGWGIRRRRNARAYNVSGDLGVRLDYANGYHLLVGSKHPEALADALEALLVELDHPAARLPLEEEETE